MPPKRASRANKRKTELGPLRDTARSVQKQVGNARKHNDNVSGKVAGRPPSRLPNTGVEQESSYNAPISSRTRSRCKKRNFADDRDTIEAVTDHAQHPKPAKRRRTSNPSEQGTIEEVAQGAKALLLPVELHGLILETFWKHVDLDDREMFTMRSCASVCKVWRAAARTHLFRSIKIHSRASLERLASLVRSDSSIVGYIQKVTLLGYSGNCKSGWLYAFPSLLETPLRSLRTLEIRHVNITKPQKKDLRAYCDWIRTLSELASVRQLYIGLVSMSPNALTALVRAFPHLTKVWLEQTYFSPLKDRVPLIDESSHATDAPRFHPANDRAIAYPILHPPSAICSLKVDNFASDTPFNFDCLKDCFIPEFISSSLTTLDLMPSVHVASAGRIITAASPSLDFLQLPTQGTSISQLKAALDLSKLVKLKTFCIYCFDENENKNEMVTAHHLISALNAPNLEILSLIIFYDASESDGFQLIDEHLERFTHLKEFRVEYFWNTSEAFDIRRRYAEQNFPLAVKRGLLQVNVHDMKNLLPYPLQVNLGTL
ncbi:hypothetical protein QCA50_014051 [Cerrena zonata]|uniref:F-box domain-containing protein n=1 Tax=Cerrena zonata TaxID=2478898 RepID=A0AAW0FYH4_9APHY